MPHLVSDDIGLRELPRRIQLPTHFIEEREVNVYAPVTGAVERSGGRFALAASRRVAAAKEHELRLLVGGAAIAKHAGPDLLGAAQDL